MTLNAFSKLRVTRLAILGLPGSYGGITMAFGVPPGVIVCGGDRLVVPFGAGYRCFGGVKFSRVVTLSFYRIGGASPRSFVLCLGSRVGTSCVSYKFGCDFKGGNSNGARVLGDFYSGGGVRLSVTTPCVLRGNGPLSSSCVHTLLGGNRISGTGRFLCGPFSFATRILRKSGHKEAVNFPAVGRGCPASLIGLHFKICGAGILFSKGRCSNVASVNVEPACRASFIVDRAGVGGFSNSLCKGRIAVVPIGFLESRGGFSSLSRLGGRVRLSSGGWGL